MITSRKFLTNSGMAACLVFIVSTFFSCTKGNLSVSGTDVGNGNRPQKRNEETNDKAKSSYEPIASDNAPLENGDVPPAAQPASGSGSSTGTERSPVIADNRDTMTESSAKSQATNKSTQPDSMSTASASSSSGREKEIFTYLIAACGSPFAENIEGAFARNIDGQKNDAFTVTSSKSVAGQKEISLQTGEKYVIKLKSQISIDILSSSVESDRALSGSYKCTLPPSEVTVIDGGTAGILKKSMPVSSDKTTVDVTWYINRNTKELYKIDLQVQGSQEAYTYEKK
ncbi:MAG: hypothetical protein HQK54_14045 [Oligoflexales bacterium]|nr:hypothetical protein [Oligoflexales bacterium]